MKPICGLFARAALKYGPAGGALAVLVVLALASSASASTIKLGSANESAGLAAGYCAPGYSWVQVARAPTSPRYRVPSNGTIVSWTTSAGITPGRAALKIWRSTSNPFQFKPVAESAAKRIPKRKLTTFSTSLAVKKGDVLGIAVIAGHPDCLQKPPYAQTGDDVAFTPGDPTSGTPSFTDYGCCRLNLSVKFKPRP